MVPPATMNRGYYSWVDSLKGIGILLVVVGHVSQNGVLSRAIFSFHMPLFFILSGLLLSPKKCNATFFKKRFTRLLTPYFFFAFVTWLYWFLLERRFRPQSTSAVHSLANIFLARGGTDNYPFNAPLWFLPCMFFASIIMNVIMHTLNQHFPQRSVQIALIAIALAGVSITYLFHMTLLPARIPFTLDIVPAALSFIAIGILAKQHVFMMADWFEGYAKSKHEGIAVRLCATALVAIAFLGLDYVVQSIHLQVDLNNLTISNPLALLVTGMVGTLLTGVLSICLDSRILRYLGQSSLTIMCVHEPIKRIVVRLMGIVTRMGDAPIRTEIPLILVAAMITTALSLLVYAVMHRCVPAIIGERIIRNEKTSER
jgi:fucose 4-O-acetylase-like acetyltransferase